jgi:hypothetical protein
MKGLPSSSLHPPDMLYIFPSPPCDGGTAAQPAAQEEWPHRRDRGPGIIHRSPPSTAEAWSWSASASAWQCLSRRLAASASWMMDEAIAKAGFCLALLVQQSNSPIESPGQWRNDGVFVTA